MGLIKDKTVGIICLGIGLMTLVGTRGLLVITPGTGFGPAAFPAVVGAGLIVLSIILIVKSRFARDDTGRVAKPIKILYKPLVILLLTCLYTGLILLLGFLISTILFVFAMTRLFGEKSIKVNALFSVSLGLLIDLVFVLGLRLPLPAGWLPGLLLG